MITAPCILNPAEFLIEFMMNSFDDFLRGLMPPFPHGLIPPDVIPVIRSTARRLAPIYRGGFECRLAPDNYQVDLHQCILNDDDEPKRLLDYIRGAGYATHPVWNKVEHFCQEWSRPASLLNRRIPAIWLEFDLERDSCHLSTPSIFFQLNPDSTDGDNIKDIDPAAKAALELLISRSSLDRFRDTLSLCAASCPEGVRITHIGAMLARDKKKIRVNIGGLATDQWMDFLEKISWPGSIPEIAPVVESLYGQVDQTVLCLDVGRDISWKLGLECMMGAAHNGKVKWDKFLNYLVDIGLCSPEKRKAVLAWPDHIKPPDAAQKWPEHLIIESLLRDPDYFSVFSQIVNHIKIVFHPSRALEAKSYLWLGHVWVQRNEIDFPETTITSKGTDES